MNEKQTSKGATVKKTSKIVKKIEPTKPEPKKEPAKDITRIESLFIALQNAGGKIELKKLAETANQIYTDSGKKNNISESRFTLGYFTQTLICFGIAKVEGGILTVKKG